MSETSDQVAIAASKIDLWRGRVHDAVGQAMITWMTKIIGQAMKNAPGDIGHLKASLTPGELEQDGSRLSIKGGTNLAYAPWVENGSAPHEKSKGHEDFVASMLQWASRHGMDENHAWAVIRYIQKNGTKAHPFLMPAFYTLKGEAQEDIRKAAAES